MSKAFKLITTAAAFDAAVIQVNKDAQSLNTAIQALLASAVFFAVKDGNTGPLNALIPAVGKGVRKTAIAQWVLAFAPVVMNDNAEQAKTQPFKFSREKLAEKVKPADAKAVTAEESTVYATKAHETLWTDYKEPPLVPESWSLTDAITKLVKQATDMQGKGVKVKGADLLAGLKGLTERPNSDVASV